MKTTGEKITDIIKPYLNVDKALELDKVQSLLEGANFNLEEVGYDNVKDLLEDLDEYFDLSESENATIVICKKVNIISSEKTITPQRETSTLEQKATALYSQTSQIPTIEFDPQQTKSTNDKLVKILRELTKTSSDVEGRVTLTAFGQKKAAEKIELPIDEKFGVYLKRFPELFELTNNGIESCVRLAQKNKTNISPVQPKITERFVSLYNLLDFAYFPDYSKAKVDLASIAQPNGWFIIPDSNERDPNILVDYKLREKFALIIYEYLQGQTANIYLYPDHAWFDTGFITPEGQHIIANFTLNQCRKVNENSGWQTWLFNGYSILDE